MGAQFARTTQISPAAQGQLEWVPRSPDVDGGGAQGMRLGVRDREVREDDEHDVDGDDHHQFDEGEGQTGPAGLRGHFSATLPRGHRLEHPHTH